MSFKIIRNINLDNVLFGGMIYHHQETVDIDERNKLFDELINSSKGNATDNVVSPTNIYDFKSRLENIKNSQSLTASAMQKTFDMINEDEVSKHPFDEIYSIDDSENIFISEKIKIVDGDLIIFLQHTGIVGDVFNHNIPNQKLAVLYNYNEELEIYTGRIIDQKIYEDYISYKNVLESLS